MQMLKRMAAMRAAKARKRMAGPTPEPAPPRLVRWTGLSLGVRDETTGAPSEWAEDMRVREIP